MNAQSVRKVLEALAKGGLTVDAALDELRASPIEDMGFARIDTHRSIRCGFPEVVFCQGKTPAQSAGIAAKLYERCGRVLATRADAATREAIVKALNETHPDAEVEISEPGRILRAGAIVPRRCVGDLLVACAGTADIPVAEEAAFTARAMGTQVKTLYDVGVAGIHRLLSQSRMVQRASAVVVAAGMEGALASVVGGMIDRPVIAVPTSVGYGASFGGVAALLAMLNSCASNVTVVNIDNGFGAGYVGTLINDLREPRGEDD